MNSYLRASRSFHYSIFLTAPILVIYEIGIHLLFRNSIYEVRNTGDLLLKNLLTLLQLNNPLALTIILLTLFGIVMVIGFRRESIPEFRSIYLLYMLGESLVWGVGLFLVMSLVAALPLQMNTLVEGIAQFNLALGAGIYEELVFRAALIPAFAVIFHRAFGINIRFSQLIALVLAAAIFASFHLFMEEYQLAVFVQRIAGGILLGLIYVFRGYGIAVYSHVLFNMIILIQAY